jgi:hypothetical protein
MERQDELQRASERGQQSRCKTYKYVLSLGTLQKGRPRRLCEFYLRLAVLSEVCAGNKVGRFAKFEHWDSRRLQQRAGELRMLRLKP